MRFDVLTIFPKIINDYCAESILGRARKAGLIQVNAHNFRDYSKDKHKHVDDHPYGGGPGMILQVQPIYDCLLSIGATPRLSPPLEGGAPKGRGGKKHEARTKIIILDPAGKKFDQKMASKFSKLDRLALVCGRYEGFDARVYKLCHERISIGDYVLAGGELPALTIIEAVSRLIPGVLGNEESLREETFGLQTSDFGLQTRAIKRPKSEVQSPKSVEYPQYTRPESFAGWKVPKVLLSGDHKLIGKWRQLKSKNSFKVVMDELSVAISKNLKGKKMSSLEKQVKSEIN